ncbi:MAG: MlaD family protein [Pseudohongiella sp.]|nr:MlaD family protein [Pseudohongiella sp.]MDP2129016.1 MlaD family protein [Pseudohongiella sp.]
METRAHHILIGFFSLLAGAALLAFVLWMSRSGGDGELKRYDILFKEPVSGLSVGSAVQYSGIRVGDVERLTLDPQDPRQVWARVRLSASTPVKTDTSARLALLNITGASSIELSQGTPESPFLGGDATIPVIEAQPSPLTQLRLSSEELLVNVTSLVESANRLLSEENAAYVTRVLTNLDTVTTALAEEQAVLRAGLQSLVTAGNDMSRFVNTIEDQILSHSEPILTHTANTLGNLERVSLQIEELVQENRGALNQGMRGVAEIDPAMRELRGALHSLNLLINRLSEDPAGFLIGGDNIRDYQP